MDARDGEPSDARDGEPSDARDGEPIDPRDGGTIDTRGGEPIEPPSDGACTLSPEGDRLERLRTLSRDGMRCRGLPALG
eukprot:1913771-Prymnesium_polylepis.1